MDSNHLGPIVYKLLYNDVPKKIPNPNLPENVPRLNALRREQVEKTKRFWDGKGAVLFDRWQEKIKANMFELLVNPDDGCTCPSCNKLRELSNIVKLLSEAQLILDQE